MTRDAALAKARRVLAAKRAQEAARRARRAERDATRARAHAEQLKAMGRLRLAMMIREGLADAMAIRATGRDNNGRAWK